MATLKRVSLRLEQNPPSEASYARSELVGHILSVNNFYKRAIAMRVLATWDDEMLMSHVGLNSADEMVQLLIKTGEEL